MAYVCQNFKNGQVLTAECLNKMEKGIEEACNNPATGVYVGSGDMPEGYSIQIDPNAEADVPATQEWVTAQIQAAINASWGASY